MPEMSQQDTAELAARRALDAQVRAKYRGWKPLTVWYAFWCVALAVGAFASITKSFVGFLILAVAAGLAGWYTKYLYDGGTRRVWFFFF